MFVDPKGELAAKVKADFALGQQVGVEHTPTIYIVSNTQRGTPFVEVVDRTQLYQLIDQMMKGAEDVPGPQKSQVAAKGHPEDEEGATEDQDSKREVVFAARPPALRRDDGN